MANAQLLDNYITNSGKTKLFLANKMGVSRPRFNTILKKPDTATVSQAEILSSECSITLSDKLSIFLT